MGCKSPCVVPVQGGNFVILGARPSGLRKKNKIIGHKATCQCTKAILTIDIMKGDFSEMCVKMSQLHILCIGQAILN